MDAPAHGGNDLGQRYQALHEFVEDAQQRLSRNSWGYLVGGAVHSAFPLRGFGPEGVR